VLCARYTNVSCATVLPVWFLIVLCHFLFLDDVRDPGASRTNDMLIMLQRFKFIFAE